MINHERSTKITYNMKRISLALMIAVFMPLLAMGADAKFFRKAAEKVWKTRPDLFDPYREIPDSLKEGVSAVIIGEYNYINADYKAFEDMRGVETRSESECFTRRMVKLLDSNAVEEFSKHEFGESSRIKARFRKSLAESDNAFGARIYKPDGTVTEVDLSKAFVIDEGKKGGGKKGSSRIIDIPGLEPGDVLEYFDYQRSMVSELDLPKQRIVLSADYPVLDVVVEAIFDPKLTVQFRGYNGVPKLDTSINDSGDYTAWLRGSNIPVLTDKRYVNEARELPFYEFYILNNTSPYRFYPKYSRGGGLYQNPAAGTIFRDIALGLAAANYDTSTLPGKIRRIIKDYRKAHPEATTEELQDMAWAAANYANNAEKDQTASDYWLAIMMCDILKKEKLAESAGVAFINPNTDVPTSEILHWRQPDFGILVDGKLYLGNSLDSFMPGELPAIYQGQLCASYPGDRKQLWDITMPTIITTPVSKSGDNKINIQSVVTLGDDNEAIITNDLTFTGAAKNISGDFITVGNWMAEMEDYLGIDSSKGYKKKIMDAVEYDKAIKESAEELYGKIYVGDDADISNVKVKEFGITPKNPDFKLSFDAKVPELVSAAGDELIVRIGNLAGDHHRIEGVERERMVDIDFTAATQENFDITLNIPEGYDVDEKSMEALAMHVQSPVGLFATGAKKSDDGRSVVVSVRSRLQRPQINISGWPAVLELTDAKAGFADAVLVLKKI